MPLLFPKTRALLFGAIAIFILFATFLTDALGPSHDAHSPRDYLAQQQSASSSSQWHSTASRRRWRELTDPWAGRKDPTKILLASVLYDDEPGSNELLERALLTHEKHAERWGYGTAVLRKRLVDGWWGKWGWLQALVTMELNKDAKDAAEWIMFLAPTSILSDPTIPLSLFLPPTTLTTNLTSSRTPGAQPRPVALNDVHFLGAYDPAPPATANPDFPAVSPHAFFLRVHPWSAAFLQHLLAAPLLSADPNLPVVVDESFALAKTLADASTYGVLGSSSAAQDADADATPPYDPAGFAHIVLQPARWYAWSSSSAASAAAKEEEADGWWLRAAEHFPPALGGRRWKGMADAVADVERGRMDRAYPFGVAEDAKVEVVVRGGGGRGGQGGVWGRLMGRWGGGGVFFSSSGSGSGSTRGGEGGADDIDDTLDVAAVPTALVTARAAAAANNYTRPDPDADGAGPAEAWDFWEGVARARAVLREAEEAHERAPAAPGSAEDDLESQTLAEGVARLKAAVSWGAGRKAAMREAVAAVREAMYGTGRTAEDGWS
ncbi:galactosyl transferase gma12 mnn10 family protein [Diplodia corticola]|uniref:Galactosyl transferase gma12 mnn10 family protein n=1 Tax=Diplodia corticola TaxID=236234 RepID=A0A1J9RQI1_9PEZI|nr:galactosyl transferase gma12 mnn10 family protein [Diplodia corticola]OJD30156.1 galactosyl transferase gma12 mnn10 family protein [Diplodia corticola]